ncbi:DAK2 domain-containing protein [Lutispora saccharofermentans]|uniref:DAK2 domain-containing protein n=1 Tax=Lutispora saccharofermentans TaxID=3024236 RepID=A0ABT1NCJ4_9FIRM|nr:DAK2 domain-containing protein [Lutispora saccharofermentans]MCQ1528051.1 DAK2 domain-containing protein [Lutispora saccharofermentans]
MIISGANNLENNKSLVNSLNVFPVPDGDTGTNMSLTMNSAVKEINKSKELEVSAIADSVANGSLMGARGNSGVILSQIFRGFAKALKNVNEIDASALANALTEGSNTAYKAVMKPTEGTILTVIRESAEYGIKIAKNTPNATDFLGKVIEKADETLNRTPDMLPILKQAGVVDAGGKGLVYILKGMHQYLISENIIQLSEAMEEEPEQAAKPVYDDIIYGYCTEFFIKGKDLDPEEFKKKITEIGDSIVVVGDENLIKVHIHTNNPGVIIEKALQLGFLSKIKIDNMREQHEELLISEEDREENQEIKKYGVVAVAMGSGISSIFRDLGANEIIEGGQTMNPSTEDILKSVDRIRAENIIILPNNGNIILAANQAKSLSNKNIIVAPTKSIPQGISALMTLDQEKSPEDNEKKISKAIGDVKTGLITYAVRDSNFDGVDIEEGNFLGIMEGKIGAVGEELIEVIYKVMDAMVDEDASLITLYYGNDIGEEAASKLEQELMQRYPDCDVEMHYGGQPLYYYILSVE